MKRFAIAFSAAAVITICFLISGSLAAETIPAWSAACLNSTDLRLTSNNVNQTGDCLLCIQRTVTCPFGCDSGRDACRHWPPGAMPGMFYLFIEIVAFILLFISLYRLDVRVSDIKVFDVATPVIMMILFSVLALQGNNVIDMTTGEDMDIVGLVWLNAGLAMFSLVPLFFFIFKFIRGVVSSGQEE